MTSYLELSKKLFGHCKVEWQIERFSFQTFTKQWLIQSPEFAINGSEETRWCMNLRPKLVKGQKVIFFSLKRSIIDSGPKYIWLNVKIYSKISDDEFARFNDKLLSLKNGSEYEVGFVPIQHLLSKMSGSDDLFTIVCDMIVYSNTKNREFGECKHAGLKLLSKNMLDLYMSAQNFDTKLVIDDNIILAHRAILCARNDYLCECLNDYIDSTVEEEDDDDEVDEFQDYAIINLTNLISTSNRFDFKGMRKILAYLYTGDIRYVLEEPSFAIYRCASFLEIREIETHYEPDNLILTSTIDFEEHNCILRGYEFENSFLVWHCNTEGSTKIHRLLFYPVISNNKNYTTLFIKTTEKPVLVRLKLDFVDEKGVLCCTCLVTFENVCIEMDVNISEMIKKLDSSRNIFEVNIKIGLTTNIMISHIDKHSCVSVSLTNENIYYEKLSSDLELLLDDGSYRDTVIDNNGIYFWVHKCILAARSPLFSNLFETIEEGEVIVVSNFDPNIISILLIYIYTGLFSDVMDDDVIDVYKAAVLSRLPQLQSMCSDWLKLASKSNGAIRCRIVKLAEEYGDNSLMKSILNNLFDKKDKILVPIFYNRFSFHDVNACWHCLH